jgi:hypothetical protein
MEPERRHNTYWSTLYESKDATFHQTIGTVTYSGDIQITYQDTSSLVKMQHINMFGGKLRIKSNISIHLGRYYQ